MKNFLKSILFLIILAVLIEGISFLFIPGDNIKKYGLYKVSAYDILAEDLDTIDVVAIGDSLVYSSLSPMVIWNQLGYTVFDCAEPAQIIPDTLDYLKVAIESQHPKIILMEANVLFRDPSKKKAETIITKRIKNRIPIIKYHDNWKKYISYGSKKNWINYYKGYKFITKVKPSKPKEYMSGSKKLREIPKGNIEYFEQIVELCKENNTKLILVSFPTQLTWSSKKHNAIKQLSEKYEIEFVDLNLVDLGINWETDTKDSGGHLNYLGAKKVSEYIGTYLQNTNLLQDHRDEKKYASWHKAYQIYWKKYNKVSNKS